ncbi:molecular chaperone DnaJ [Escherichia coli]|nr:molecular chaperone DnaJ [Escherichia coli]EFJ3786199.1 molecular chaperone DnaJ [Escherichia coli]EFN8027955.1 molecular chaperone DnaJ [Escherichia coli]ELM8953591.1 molecular chaperone DnaJ [Escherichia coli]MBI1051141.1 molecular chaperone DnaJ [Escherichia coli]
MTTITKERLLTIKQWRETYGPGSNVVLPAEEAEELARIALASLEAEAPSLPGGFTIKETQELYEDLVRSHISQALSGEKMKKKDRDADLRWTHGVIVQAGWFVKASLEQNALSGNSPVTPDGWVIVPKKLTAENGAKGVLSGEFSETTFISCPECFGDDDCETCDGSGRIEIKVPVSWTTIKTIWAKGCEYFSIVAPQQDG